MSLEALSGWVRHVHLVRLSFNYLASSLSSLPFYSCERKESQVSANMAQQQFFGPTWINKEIEFERFQTSPQRTWKTVRKIYEKNDQGPQVDWEGFDHTLMIALALFEYASFANPRKRALMKIYIQFVVTSYCMRFLYRVGGVFA